MKIYTIATIALVITLMLMLLMADFRNHAFEYPEGSYTLTLGENKYNLRKAEKKWNMPAELKEISGIAYKDERTLLCIQDEIGSVFSFDLIEESINQKLLFGKSGDYEDIALVDNTIFVLKSNGHLYNFDLTYTKETEANKFTTPLSEKNDTEGLAYDVSNNRLLIACKNAPFVDDSEEKGRAIYSFDLSKNRLDEKPMIFIAKKEYNDALQQYGLDEKKHNPFQPSGIAIHPSSGRIVVICSVGKIIIVLDKAGNIEQLVPLDSKLFVQPEGICFGPNGELFISSEGKNGKGYILKFKP
ncbi:MAG: SdiA-regulated domain-containing protein [Cyclobacteriaceae bacterium]|nr:SdiA-regulated domain-containing protein [Cyclobacteriaceae bacterium]